jgi:F-type H+-transporting ATPase subunit alpha
LQEILKQPQYAPLELEEEVLMLFAGTRGHADQIPVDQVQSWEAALLRHAQGTHPELLKEIAEQKVISPELETKLAAMLENFNRGWRA